MHQQDTPSLTKTLPTELILPAGNFEKLRFAEAFGADAVYAGTPLFSLRARSNGFTKETLREAINYMHARKKKIYLTFNIFAHNNRIQRTIDAFCEYYEWKPDGFIFSDIGLIQQALKLRPDAPIHLSTQANVTNWAAVEFWRDLGIKRIVLARELSLKEISEIHRKVPDIELEVFVHGAMCMAYSGRCLISNYVSNRNANEGTCNNACRWEYQLAATNGSLVEYEHTHQKSQDQEYPPLSGEYELREPMRMDQGGESAGAFPIDEDEHGTYLMNSKDLCAIELLSDLVDAGVMHFKVEGRSKSIHYAATIAHAYRQAVNDMYNGKPFRRELLDEVIATSNRTLMTGFLLKRPNEYGENVNDGYSKPLTHLYLGSVEDPFYEKELLWIDLKNQVSCGDTIEIISTSGTTTAEVLRLSKNDGSFVSTLSGGVRCGIKLSTKVNPFSLLRKKLTVLKDVAISSSEKSSMILL